MRQATNSTPNPVFELLATGLDSVLFFGTVAVLSTHGGPATLRTVALVLLIAPGAVQLIAFLTTGVKRLDLLRMGLGAALAAFSLALWEPEGWTWVLLALGACVTWVISLKKAASARAEMLQSSRALREEQLTPPASRRRTLLLPDVALLCLWLLPPAGTVVWLLSPVARDFLEATKDSTGSFLVALAWDAVLVALWGWSLVDCWRRKGLSDNARLVWLLFIFAGWTVGLTCYYLFVKRPELVASKTEFPPDAGPSSVPWNGMNRGE